MNRTIVLAVAAVSASTLTCGFDGNQEVTTIQSTLSCAKAPCAAPFLVREIRAGIEGADLRELTDVKGTLFFTAADGVSGNAIWKSDGSAEGTELVKAGFVGHPNRLAAAGGRLFFRADDGIHGLELWTSDGTEAGTRLVKDINPSGSSFATPAIDRKGRLLFTADDGRTGVELWVSDGSAAGTHQVADIAPGAGSSHPAFLTVTSDGLVFRADDGIHGFELWTSDGTAPGTRLLADIHPGGGSEPRWLTAVGGGVFFSADDGLHGRELWRVDASGGAPALVADIVPGPVGTDPLALKAMGKRLFFVADDGIHGHEPWVSNGRAAGTRLIRDINPGPAGSSPFPSIGVRQLAFFPALDPATGHELWVTSQGDPAETHLVKDIVSGPGHTFGGDPDDFRVAEGRVIFQANDRVSGVEPWWSDGTEAGTRMVDVAPGPASSFPNQFQASGQFLFFNATVAGSGGELWALPLACLRSE